MTPESQEADGNQKIVTDLGPCFISCSYDFINTFHLFGDLRKVHLSCSYTLLYLQATIKEDLVEFKEINPQ